MSFNTRSPAVKRLLKEAQELKTQTELYFAQPLEDNIFEWHFTIRGSIGTDFEGYAVKSIVGELLRACVIGFSSSAPGVLIEFDCCEDEIVLDLPSDEGVSVLM